MGKKEQIAELLKQRETIEKQITDIDEKALVYYEDHQEQIGLLHYFQCQIKDKKRNFNQSFPYNKIWKTT